MNQKESIGRWVSLIYRQGQIYLKSELKELNIGGAQIPFLTTLYNRDGLSQKEISDELHVDKATTGRDIKKLEQAGYVTRKHDPADRRINRIFLTTKAKRQEKRIKEILAKWTLTLSSGFTEKEYAFVLELMKRMHLNVLQSKESKFISKRGYSK